LELGVHGDPRHPRQPLAREDERPCISLLARHLGVDEDVLQLSRPGAAGGAHPEARSPKADSKVEAAPQVRGVWPAAAWARFDLKPRLH
jgi:hypothetical protein